MTLLENLQIYGIDSLTENAVLASMLLGEPTLMIGLPGTAKTELVAAIGAALRESSKRKYPNEPDKWFNYHVYDTSKINFEDLVGYPNINKLTGENPTVEYVETASTIWDKDLVGLDELNRCSKDRQSNLFEILRHRTIHGAPTRVKFIFSTINPFGDAGTQEMSDALVDRHLFFLRFSRFAEMADLDKSQIINRVGSFDAYGLKFWNNDDSLTSLDTNEDTVNDTLADIGDKLASLFEEAGDLFHTLQKDTGKPLNSLINGVVADISNLYTGEDSAKYDISGRRAAMMYRGLLAIRAIELAKGKIYKETPRSFKSLIINTIKLTLPFGIAGKPDKDQLARANKSIETTVDRLYDTFEKGTEASNSVVYELYCGSNPFRKLEILLENNIEELQASAAWTDLFNSQDKDAITVQALCSFIDSNSKILPSVVTPSDNEKVADIIRRSNNLSDGFEIEGAWLHFEDEIRELGDTYRGNELLSCTLNIMLEYYVNPEDTEDKVYMAYKDIKRICAKINEIVKVESTENEQEGASWL